MKFFVKILVLSLLSFNSLSVFAQRYGWPFVDSDQQRSITGSVGEYRRSTDASYTDGFRARFHQGVDITDGTNYEVHAINSGTATWHPNTGNPSYAYVDVLGGGITIRYYHIVATGQIQAAPTTVAAGDVLGNMYTANPDWGPHVHIQEATTNFLHNHLYPYVDSQAPSFLTTYLTNGIDFFRNGIRKHVDNYQTLRLTQTVADGSVNRTLLFDKVDIAAHANDLRTGPDGIGTGGQLTPTKIGWSATDYRNTEAVHGELVFEGLPDDPAAEYAFHPLSQTGSTAANRPYIAIHILTTHPRTTPYDRFWNTRLRAGQAESWQINQRPATLDARHAMEAAYPDGKYTISVTANDVDYAHSPNNQAIPRTAQVLIDNFKPFVKEVIATKGSLTGRLVVRNYWEWNESTSQFDLRHDQADEAGASDVIYVKITTSEPAQTLSYNIPDDNNTTYTALTPVANTNNTQFVFTVNPIATTGDHYINIQGTDLAGNVFQSNPAIPSMRQPDGTWGAGSSPGPDINHYYFKTGTFVCTNTNPGGRTYSNSTSPCLYVDFNSDKPAINVSEAIVFTPIVSGTGVINYLWNFGDGATPATSTSSGSQTVVYSTSGSKTISLKICDGTGGCATETKTSIINVNGSASSLTVDFTSSLSVVNVNQTLALTSTVTGASGTVSYLWTFDAGANGSTTSVNPSVSWSTPGNKSISLTVTDDVTSVTKVYNSRVYVKTTLWNISPAILGCPITTPGTVSFSPAVSGGNGPPYDSYLWDFGDGTTATSSGLTQHDYTRAGKYTVRLTVKQGDLIGTAEVQNCVTVTANPANDPPVPDFRINDQLFGNIFQPVTVGLNVPVTFKDASTGGGGQQITYNWDFDSHYTPFDGSTEYAMPSNASDKGPIEVYYSGTGDHQVSLTYDGIRKTVNSAVTVVTGRGSGRCVSKVNEPVLSSTCWSSTSVPQFSFTATSNCPIAKYEVLYFSGGAQYVLPNNSLAFGAGGIPMPQFPLTADFAFVVYQYDGLNYNRIGYIKKRYTIYGPVAVNAGADQSICLGAGINIGPAIADNNLSYQWYPGTTSQGPLNLLSSTTVSNPTFIGSQKGTFGYRVRATSNLSGCLSPLDEVLITVDKPEVTPASFFPSLNEPKSVGPQVTGGYGSNTYSWSPATYLSSATTASPTFQYAHEGAFNYTLTVTDAKNCHGSGQVFINVSNAAGNAAATGASYTRIHITWVDRSNNETGFLIRRSVGDANNFVDLATVPANTQSYDDSPVVKGTNYYYDVVTLFPSGNVSGSPITVNTGDLPPYTEVTLPVGQSYAGIFGDIDFDFDLDIFNNVVGKLVPVTGKLYKNINGTFTPSNAPVMGHGFFLDADSDSDLDIFAADPIASTGTNNKQLHLIKNTDYTGTYSVTTTQPTGQIAKPIDYNTDNNVDVVTDLGDIYKNNGTGTFTLKDMPIDPGMIPLWSLGDFVEGIDFNYDGAQDIVIATNGTGVKGFPTPTPAYVSTPVTLTTSSFVTGDIEPGDIDNDSRIDYVANGFNATTVVLMKENNGVFTATNLMNIPSGHDVTVVRLGDMDSDGDLDLLMSSVDPVYRRIYQNNGGQFSEFFSVTGGDSFQNWADLDNDGDLDIVTTGNKYYLNNRGTNQYTHNTRPTPPKYPCSWMADNKFHMTWSAATDAETPAPGLTYNIYVKIDNFSDPQYFAMSPMANVTSGMRKIAQRGNTDHNLTWAITPPEYNGKISWGVQAIDNQFIGSEFASSESQFFFDPDQNLSLNIAPTICGTVANNMNYQGKTITTPGNTTACPGQVVTIASGTTATIAANTSITLKPGFHAALGSNFRAYIRGGGGLNGPCNAAPSGRIASDDSIVDEKLPDDDIIKIFPNPTMDVFKVMIVFGQQTKTQIDILDLRGVVVASKKYEYTDELIDSFDLSGVASGMYLVKITTELGVKTRKVIKE